MKITNEDLFYCYSKELSTFIYKESGIVPLTIAINPKSKNIFSLYSKSDELLNVLDKYKEQSNK